jgi:hypothetical protein
MNRQSFKWLLKAAQMLILPLALALACGAAKADTIGTYDVSGTLTSGGTLSGTFAYDYSATSGGINPITAVDLTVDGVTFTGCPASGGTCNLYIGLDGGTQDGFTVNGPDGSFLQLSWDAVDMSTAPVLTFSSTTICVDCNDSGQYKDWGQYYDYLASGTAVDPPGVPTPEGSSISMLLTGLLSLGAFLAWRSRQGKAAGQLA